MKFIDIHNHFAWDIDDGMESREQAEIALKKAYADGVRVIVSTPHFIPGKQDKNDVAFMNQRIEELKVLAKQYGIEVYSGSEIFLDDDFLDMLIRNCLIRLQDLVMHCVNLMCEKILKKMKKQKMFCMNLKCEI